MPTPDNDRLDRIVAEARRAAERRGHGYRERALKMYPWICGRCAREFTRANLHELTVHHRNHNHDDNPADQRRACSRSAVCRVTSKPFFGLSMPGAHCTSMSAPISAWSPTSSPIQHAGIEFECFPALGPGS